MKKQNGEWSTAKQQQQQSQQCKSYIICIKINTHLILNDVFWCVANVIICIFCDIYTKTSAKFGRNANQQPNWPETNPSQAMIYFMYTIINPSFRIDETESQMNKMLHCTVHPYHALVYQVATKQKERTQTQKKKNETKRNETRTNRFY